MHRAVVAAVALLAVLSLVVLSSRLFRREAPPEKEPVAIVPEKQAPRAPPPTPAPPAGTSAPTASIAKPAATAEPIEPIKPERPVDEKVPPEKAAPKPVVPPPEPLPRDGVPASLAFLFDESLDPMTRQRRLSGMYKMVPEEIAVMRQLRCNTEADDGLRDTAVAQLVEHGEHLKKNFADEAAAMLWDERQTPRFRGYCVRYLHRSYDARPDPAILETLFRAAGAKEHDVRASAIHFLAKIAKPRRESKKPDAATFRRIRARILEALRDENEHERVRMCAVRCCGSLGLTEAAPDIRRIAGDEALGKSFFRQMAIYCLGDVGGAEDIPFLEGLMTPDDAPSAPERGALEKLKKRLAQEQF